MKSQVWWFVARSSGLVAWALAVASVLWGLALASKAFGRRPTAGWLLDLHRFLGATTVVFTAVHVAALMLDDYVDFGWADVAVPFVSEWRPGAVAWGIVAMYLLVAIEATSLLKRRMPARWWRRAHLLSFPLASVATMHLLQAGTDAAAKAVLLSVAGAGVLVIFVGYLRILIPRRTPRPAMTSRP